MKYLFTLLLSLSTFAETTPTDNYLALTAMSLELKIINDEHLLRMIDGQLNPILETEAQINSPKRIAKQAYENLISLLREGAADEAIQKWVREKLSQEAKERNHKNQQQKESHPIIRNFRYNRIASYETHTKDQFGICHLNAADHLICDGKSTSYSGTVIKSKNHSILLVTLDRHLLKINPIDGTSSMVFPQYAGQIQDFELGFYSCILLTNEQVVCQIEGEEPYAVKSNPVKQISMSDAGLYLLHANGQISCHSLREYSTCETPSEIAGHVQRIIDMKDQRRICVILTDDSPRCYKSGTHKNDDLFKTPDNLMPIETIIDVLFMRCGVFKTGLFSCWGFDGKSGLEIDLGDISAMQLTQKGFSELDSKGNLKNLNSPITQAKP